MCLKDLATLDIATATMVGSLLASHRSSGAVQYRQLRSSENALRRLFSFLLLASVGLTIMSLEFAQFHYLKSLEKIKLKGRREVLP
jgi:hypothetical protein